MRTLNRIHLPRVNVAATVKSDGHGCPTVVESTSCGASTASSNDVCASNDDDVVEWTKENSTQKDFTIVPRQGSKICKTNGSGKTKCKVKKPNPGAFGDAEGLAFKYDIVTPNCTTVDPYIIVLK